MLFRNVQVARPAATGGDEGFLTDFFRGELPPRLRWAWPGNGMPVDVHEYKDRFVLHADLPGIREADIKIEFAEGNLVLEATRPESRPSDGDFEVLVDERPKAGFRRSFALGEQVQADRIEATFANGTLTVTLPKAQQAVPRVIPITIRKA